jgi:DNA polymerase III epsilon subunit family exonuclease
MEKKDLPILAFVDVETTGLSTAYNDRIIEIALLKCQGAKILGRWESLVNPCRPISPGASAVNGITNKMVAAAPKFGKIAAKLLEHLQDTVLVCHNVPFDLGFLSAEFENCGRTFPNLNAIDTLKIARQYFDFPSNSLGNIAAYLEIDVEGQHRAMVDVVTTHRIFTYFFDELVKRGLEQFDQLYTPHFWFPRSSLQEKKTVSLPPLLEEALKSKKNIQLSYLSGAGEETRRVVIPLKIINRYDYLYLEAFCQLRNEKRTFRLDRVIKMKLLS